MCTFSDIGDDSLVTEALCGEDLVEHAIWLSSGKKLPERLSDRPTISPSGVALCANVFLAGSQSFSGIGIGSVIGTYIEPPQIGEGEWSQSRSSYHNSGISTGSSNSSSSPVRVDSMVLEGCYVPPMYHDSALVALTSTRGTRAAALTELDSALEKFVIRGTEVTLSQLKAVMKDKE